MMMIMIMIMSGVLECPHNDNDNDDDIDNDNDDDNVRSDRMSGAPLFSSSDTEHGALENPYAVWLRNVPTWLDEDR